MAETPSSARRFGASLLTLGITVALCGLLWAPASLAGPAKEPNRELNDHPSGRDRTGSAGASGAQGRSWSDPDGVTNGGADKPGGSGGFDADKDGNNGCGNDDDFEDDNNGWCGRRRTRAGAAGAAVAASRSHKQPQPGPGAVSPAGAGTTVAAATVAGAAAGPPVAPGAASQVLGVELEQPGATAGSVLGGAVQGAAEAPAAARVLGASTERAAGDDESLAFTGIDALALLALAAVLLSTGGALTAVRRRHEVTA